MKRAVLLVLVLVASLVATPLASAQVLGGGLLITRVCGANGCKSVFNGLVLIRPGAVEVKTTGPPPIGGYYILEPSNYRTRDQAQQATGPTTPAFFVPASGTLRARPDPTQLSPQTWIKLPLATESALRSALRGLEPFAPPKLTEVVIAGRRTGRVQSYDALFDSLPRAREPFVIGRGSPIAIVVRAAEPSPWTDGHNRLAYYPDLGLLYRDGEWVRPSAELIDRIEYPTAPGGGVPWSRVGGIAGPLVLLGTILVLWLLTGRRPPEKFDAAARPQ
ncbi:MAG TPA: hypothetical protein VGJ34_07215 [Gaiellaceae bacterium]|jgi:hypothetical protein